MRLLFSLLILAAIAWAGFFLYHNPGDIEISYQNWVIEIRSILVILFIAIVLVYTVVATIFSTYRKFREWVTGSTLRAVTNNANQGWSALAQGDWERAEALLLKAAKHSDHPEHYYLAAAKAAQALGAVDRRDNCLRLALRAAPHEQVAIGLTKAELQLQHGQWEHSFATLQDLYKLAPHNTLVLKLYANISADVHEWQEVIKLLPQLKKHNVFSAEDLAMFEANAYNDLLHAEAKKSDKQALETFWDNLPKNVRLQPLIVQRYVELLLELGAMNEAEQAIRVALKRQWDIELVRLYGLALSSDLGKQISTAESWLKSYQTEPVLLLTLARLCLANKLWGKARSHLDASLAIESNADAYAELGRLLGFLGEQQKAMECYKKGLFEFAEILPIENMQVKV